MSVGPYKPSGFICAVNNNYVQIFFGWNVLDFSSNNLQYMSIVKLKASSIISMQLIIITRLEKTLVCSLYNYISLV